MVVYTKLISRSEAKYEFKIIKSDKKQQSTYNVPESFFNYAVENDVLIEVSDIEGYPREDDNIFVLNDDYTFKLGSGVLGLIGDEWDECNNKFIVSTSKSQSYKPQMYKIAYKKLSSDYNWFVELYDKNFYGTEIILDLNEENKVLTFDLRINLSFQF